MKRSSLFIVLIAGLLLRLFLTPHFTYKLDVLTYIYWSDSLFQHGFKNFFTSNWVDYLPGFPYILWLLAAIKHSLSISAESFILLLYKFPAILADLATGFLIYKLLGTVARPSAKRYALRALPLLATAAYLFNPAIFANSSLWGQTDSFTALFALLSLYFTLNCKPLWAGLSLGLGSLIKLNTIFVAPVLAIFLLSQKRWFSSGLILGISSLIIFLVGFIPFLSQSNLLNFVSDRVAITTNQYPHTSLNAFNLWFLRDGSWKSDQITVLGLTKHFWGNLMFLLVYGATLLKLLRTKSKSLVKLTPIVAIGFIAAFLLLTRMHERHLFPAFPFLVLAAALTPRYWYFYAWFSLSYLINLLFGYQSGPGNPVILNVSISLAKFLSLANLVAFAGLVGSSLLEFKAVTSPRLATSSSSLSRFRPQTLLIAILVFSFGLRLFRLSVPPDFHFDEVYHAFTAKEMLVGNVKAWEWWNTPPQSVAYEWTHPPMAKHFMVLGMQLFGATSFGWRFPGVLFGTANILLVYLLAKELFLNTKYKIQNTKYIPLLAAALYSVESLSFVQSRIGMNDTYMVFFVLLSLLTLLKKKYPASMLSFGLALATKWSAIYIAPVLFLTYTLNKQISFKKVLEFLASLLTTVTALLGQITGKKPAKSTLASLIARLIKNSRDFFFVTIGYLLLAIAVYLLSYLPFFLSGHSWSQFIELQKQMYWYHTRLKATHDYTSPWWSWPIMLRPVWYYVKYGQDTIANIYAFGNPAIFWGGLLAVLYTIIHTIKNLLRKKYSILNTQYSIPILGYFAFLLPWALSPRIMFLYHYLPSIPFMIILLAWSLTQLWHSGRLGRSLVISHLSLVIGLFIFFYPHLTALPVSRDWANLYYWFTSWK